jgi:hypothetical protein
MNYIIVLPCYGAPFIKNGTAVRSNSKEMNALLNESVGGEQSRFENDEFHKMVIHPSFCEDEKRWDIVRLLMGREDVQLFVHENGMNVCCPNMACLYVHRDMSGLRYWTRDDMIKKPWVKRDAPFFGDVAMVVPVKTLMRLTSPDCLKLIPETEWEHLIENCKCDDNDCEGNCETIQKHIKERNWEYTGTQMFKNVIGRK